MATSFARYNGDIASNTAAAYISIAKRHGLDPAQMALAFVNSRSLWPARSSAQTTMAQLKTNVASIDVKLSDEVVAEIDAVHKSQPNPCP